MGEPVVRALWGVLCDLGLDAHTARTEAHRLDRELDYASQESATAQPEPIEVTVARTVTVLDAHVDRMRKAYDDATKKRIALAYERGVVTELRLKRAASCEAKCEPAAPPTATNLDALLDRWSAGFPSAEMP